MIVRQPEIQAVSAKLQFITPEIAKRMLAKNLAANRKKRNWHIKDLAGIIKRGEWIITHQGIAFDVNDNLLDGQHRLEAVIEANQGVYMMVTYGLPAGSYMALDQGINRTHADVLGIDARVAYTLRYACELYNSSSSRVTPEQAMQIGRCGLIDAIQHLIDATGTTRRYFTSSPFKLAAAIRIMEKPLENTAYVCTQYKAIVMSDFAAMTPVSQAITRQVSKQDNFKSCSKGNIGIPSVATKKRDVLARGLIVFDRKQAHKTAINVYDQTIESTVEHVRSVIKKTIESAQQFGQEVQP